MTTEPKIIAVTGATGAQGGGLVRAILDHPECGFVPRTITRDPCSGAARSLAAEGVEVVRADLDRRLSLVDAFAGTHGAFCMTDFWSHLSPERELVQAANLAAAAKTAGVRHAIWSTLEDTRRFFPLDDDRVPTLMGQYKVPHFDAKGIANSFFRAAAVPTTFLLPSFFWDNLVAFDMGPHENEDGLLELTLPLGRARLTGIAAADVGACALGVFAGGARWIDQAVGVSGGHLTGGEMASALTAALGRGVLYRAVGADEYRASRPGAEDLGNMFQFFAEFADVACRTRDLEVTRTLHPGVQSFATWLAANRDRLPSGALLAAA